MPRLLTRDWLTSSTVPQIRGHQQRNIVVNGNKSGRHTVFNPAVCTFLEGKPARLLVIEAALQGFDATSHASPGFVGAGYRHDENSGKGAMSARFTPNLPKAGSYQVGIAWSAAGNRATNVPVTIRHSREEFAILLNQRLGPQGDGAFHVLGTFEFAAGREGWVEIRNTGTDGHVVVDAVQWLPVE